MAEEQHNAMTDAEIFAAAWVATGCAACSRVKRASAAFCQSCTFALPIWVRGWLGGGPSDAHAVETFRIWLRHLQLNADRIKRSGWDFKSWQEIEAAGFTLLNVSRCRALGCGQRIGWVEDKHGAKTPVNVDGEQQFQPHRTSCKNPGVFRERKTVQASARTKKRAR